MLEPFTAAIEKLSKKDATATLIALLLAYTLIAFGIAASVNGAFRWLIGSTGAISFLAGLGKRPDVDDDHRTAAATLLPVLLALKQSKHAVVLSEKSEDSRDG